MISFLAMRTMLSKNRNIALTFIIMIYTMYCYCTSLRHSLITLHCHNNSHILHHTMCNINFRSLFLRFNRTMLLASFCLVKICTTQTTS